MLNNKKGSVPVTMLVILTLVLFIVLLIAFSFIAGSLLNKVKNGYKNVQDYNAAVSKNSFLGNENAVSHVEQVSKRFLGVRNDIVGESELEMSVVPYRE